VKTVALLGNPNSGKTTLFNALTGKKNKVANWAGVTVEISSAIWNHENLSVNIIDLPGCYSLCNADISGAPDEKIAANFLFENKVDIIVNILDSSNLTRSLYLTTQLLELGLPVIILLNKVDLISKKINLELLRTKLKNPKVLSCETNNKNSVAKLKHDLSSIINSKPQTTDILIKLPEEITSKINRISTEDNKTEISNYSYGLYLLGGHKTKNQELEKVITKYQEEIQDQLKEDLDIVIAQERYNFIRTTVKEIETKQEKKQQSEFIQNLDYFLTHKYFGIINLLLIMYFIFAVALNIGNCFQSLFNSFGEVFLITGFNLLLTKISCPEIVKIFLIQGLGQGTTTLLSFIPIVFAMFYSIAVLEETGYMPRAAFVTDRLMKTLHLPGKAFIPLIIGFSCNVPAILATRTLESYRDRIIAGLMTPFMMCNARLAVFAIFSSTFFPNQASLVILAMYVTGIITAIITGIIVCRLIIPGEIQPLIMELPEYQIPKQRLVLKRALFQTKSFCHRVGVYIIGLSAIISILSTYQINSSTTLLSLIGKSITPLFSPIGISIENWAATVGILAGFIAKETVIITLSQIYHGSNLVIDLPSDFIHYAISTLHNSLDVTNSDSFIQEQLKIHFTNTYSVIAYMIFNLLYIPCISTMIAFAKETSWRWALFSTSWSLTLAFAVATLIFQQFNSPITIISIIFILGMNIIFARRIITPKELKQ
jgi:ferrous iron transport protein B